MKQLDRLLNKSDIPQTMIDDAIVNGPKKDDKVANYCGDSAALYKYVEEFMAEIAATDTKKDADKKDADEKDADKEAADTNSADTEAADKKEEKYILRIKWLKLL